MAQDTPNGVELCGSRRLSWRHEGQPTVLRNQVPRIRWRHRSCISWGRGPAATWLARRFAGGRCWCARCAAAPRSERSRPVDFGPEVEAVRREGSRSVGRSRWTSVRRGRSSRRDAPRHDRASLERWRHREGTRSVRFSVSSGDVWTRWPGSAVGASPSALGAAAEGFAPKRCNLARGSLTSCTESARGWRHPWSSCVEFACSRGICGQTLDVVSERQPKGMRGRLR